MPRKQCRTRLRNRRKLILTPYTKMVAFFAYHQDPRKKWQEWEKRTISLRQAEQLVAAGEAEAIVREVPDSVFKDGRWTSSVQVVGYKALTPTSWAKTSPSTLTERTLNAIADSVGDPKDVHLSRGQRDEVLKFMVWPLIGDTKAVAVRPRISDADRAAAERLLNPARTHRSPYRMPRAA